MEQQISVPTALSLSPFFHLSKINNLKKNVCILFNSAISLRYHKW